MARIRFRKPKIGIVMGEVITLAVWLFFGDRVITVLDNLVGTDISYCLNCVNGSVFEDAYSFLGIGSDCTTAIGTANCSSATASHTLNSSNGLLGIVALVMVVSILMNFISYK